MTIGEVARRSGLSAPTLRYYERIGLLAAPDRVRGQRRYRDDVLGTLRLVRMAQEAGFSLTEIDTLLHGYDDAVSPAGRWQDLARRKIPEIEAAIQRLTTVRRVLDESLACDCLTLDACAGHGWHVQPA